MSLQEWLTKTNTLGTHPTTEKRAISVIPDPKHPLFTALWHLTDYAVSSHCGAVIWLVPR